MSTQEEQLAKVIGRLRWATAAQLSLAALLVWLAMHPAPDVESLLRQAHSISNDHWRLIDNTSLDRHDTVSQWAAMPPKAPTLQNLINFAREFEPDHHRELRSTCVRSESYSLNDRHSAMNQLKSRRSAMERQSIQKLTDQFFSSSLWACIQRELDATLSIESLSVLGTTDGLPGLEATMRRYSSAPIPQQYVGTRYQEIPQQYIMEEPPYTPEFSQFLSQLRPFHREYLPTYDRFARPLLGAIVNARSVSDALAPSVLPVVDDGFLALAILLPRWDRDFAAREGPSPAQVFGNFDALDRATNLSLRVSQLATDYQLDTGVTVSRAQQLMEDGVPVNFLGVNLPRKPANFVLPLGLVLITIHVFGLARVVERGMPLIKTRLLTDWHWLQRDWPGPILAAVIWLVPTVIVGWFAWHKSALLTWLLAGTFFVVQLMLGRATLRIRRQHRDLERQCDA